MAILRIDETKLVLDKVKVTGASASYTLTAVADGRLPTGFSWRVSIPNSAWTSYSVTLDVSDDGTTWTTIDTATASADRVVYFPLAKTYVRANVATLVGGDRYSCISVSVKGLDNLTGIPRTTGNASGTWS